MYRSSTAPEGRSAEAGETCCACGGSRSRCCTGDRGARVPKVDRRRYVTKRDLVQYGYTDECQACIQLAAGIHNVKVRHDDRCRDRIGELMAEDDDQRRGERVSSRAVPEVEIPRPQAGEKMDVGYHQSNQFPHFKRVHHRAQAQVPEQMK